MGKILVVDDREQNRGVLTTLLQYSGHELIEASNGEEALEKTRADRPGLVITDILMPRVDGWEFVRRLRSDPDLCEIPVIFYSAMHLNKEACETALACGVFQILSKPLNPEVVLTAVDRALRSDGKKSTTSPLSSQPDLNARIRVLSTKLWDKVLELETSRNQLEERVGARTAELEIANRELQREISERRFAETELRKTNEQLSARARELEDRTQEVKLLTEMSELLQACHDVDEAHRITVQFAERLFPLDSGALYLAREFGDGLEAFATWGPAAHSMKQVFQSEECWALRRGRSHVAENIDSSVACAHLPDAKPSGFICVPMMTQGHALGVLHVSWSEESRARNAQHTESTRQLTIALADSTALALSNVRLREKLKEQTIRDPLTRLFNRRYLEESLDREVSRARRAGKPIGIIMIDVDHFKTFNDTFGHQAGDEILRSLGRYLQAHVRPEDIPTRYGGEEFALILPGASLDILRERAESLRKGVHSIQETPGICATEIQKPITVSLGVAVFPEHGASGVGVLHAADEALYLAKNAGRDCVVVAGSVQKEQSAAKQIPA